MLHQELDIAHLNEALSNAYEALQADDLAGLLAATEEAKLVAQQMYHQQQVATEQAARRVV